MQRLMLTVTLTILISSTTLLAQQPGKVNESCSVMPCESGLYCVEVKGGDKKCAACDQSTLSSLTDKVEECCKTFGQGWTPESSAEYQAALGPDGRVLVDVFDKMLENAKKCREAREYRESRCWNGGDDAHKKAIDQIKESIERMAAHKSKMISDKRVYYGSKSYYESRLSTFKSKANLNFPDIDQKLSIIEKDINDGKKVDCSVIERYSNDCEYCVNAGKDLLYDGFSNSTDKFPEEYNTPYTRAQELLKRAKALLDTAKSKSLCN